MAFDSDDGPRLQASLHFQLPSFVCSTAPTLAPGGGAEVLPVSLLSDDPLATTWFSNSGFTPHSSYDPQYLPSNDHHQNTTLFQHPYQQPPPPPPQHPQSISAPFDFDSYIAHHHSNTRTRTSSPPPPPPLLGLAHAELSPFVQPRTHATTSTTTLRQSSSSLPLSDLTLPSALGLPVYSTSGFDLLSILARVANRPHPRVVLGPVDLTCSFVVVDVRRHDQPIVYCSPTFCILTGYAETEVLGRNCRFLQAPNGQVHRGEHRRYTSPDAVAHLRKNLIADKECQTSIVNYKKDGSPFMNLVTVIPISGGIGSGAPHEDSEIVYHVGFQVDLTKQPNAILEKLHDGSYVVNYSSQPRFPTESFTFDIRNISQSRDRKAQVIPSVRISKDLKKLLHDPAFVRSIPISSSTTIPPSHPPSTASSLRTESDGSSSFFGHNQLLNLLLLEASPDFIYVVSLKGDFLYVAPSVRRVLGYEAEELVGGSISDYSHPEDVVPLMRELKEGSATGLAAGAGPMTVAADNGRGGAGGVATGLGHHSPLVNSTQVSPRTIDLLFRARTKGGIYVWLECTGRLYPEPGKGRKAILLCARAKEMPRLDWSLVAYGGGVRIPESTKEEPRETEVWGAITASGHNGPAISFLVVGHEVTDMLGWAPSELVGHEVVQFIADGAQEVVEQVYLCANNSTSNPRRVYCRMRHKDGTSVGVFLVLYRPTRDPSFARLSREIRGITPAPLIYQLCVAGPLFLGSTLQTPAPLIHPLSGNIFEELETGRDSSWQYELQQIRFANQRLKDEITALERRLQGVGMVRQKIVDEVQQQNQQSQKCHYSLVEPPSSQASDRLQPSSLTPQHQRFGRHYERSLLPTLHALVSHRHPSLLRPSIRLQSETDTPIEMPIPKTAQIPSLPYDWDSSASIQNLNCSYTGCTRGLKRSWDVVTNQ